jgi:hypothetical protein
MMECLSSCDSKEIIPVSAATFGSFEKGEGEDETSQVDSCGHLQKSFGGSRQRGHIAGSQCSFDVMIWSMPESGTDIALTVVDFLDEAQRHISWVIICL